VGWGWRRRGRRRERRWRRRKRRRRKTRRGRRGKGGGGGGGGGEGGGETEGEEAGELPEEVIALHLQGDIQHVRDVVAGIIRSFLGENRPSDVDAAAIGGMALCKHTILAFVRKEILPTVTQKRGSAREEIEAWVERSQVLFYNLEATLVVLQP
jgi:hypothetical protein